jgi:hypothetical protein
MPDQGQLPPGRESTSAPGLDWLAALFSDLGIRAPHGISWSADRAELPLLVEVGLADGPSMKVELRNDSPLARMAVAERVQAHIDAAWDVGLPPCPDHRIGMRLVRADSVIHWRCPECDVACAVGDYDELLWPPRAGDEQQAAPLLARRLRRRGVTGLGRFGVTDGVVRASVHEGADEGALRAAAAPLVVEIEWVPPVGWARSHGSDGESLSITNAPMHLAGLAGPLGRSASGGLQVGQSEVRLSFAHRIGAPGYPLLCDADGVRFADEGDEVVCAGGFAPSEPVRDARGVFMVGRITRVDHPGGSRVQRHG